MAQLDSKMWTSFAKGELSPLIEARRDLAAYYEGALNLANWNLMRQGGITRRPGLRFVKEVKDSASKTIILPYVPDVESAYVLEMGNTYFRAYREGAAVSTTGIGSELVTNG